MEENNKLGGIWKNVPRLKVQDSFKIKIKKNAYVSFHNGWRYGKGTIIYDNENFTLTSTHARWLLFWIPFVEVVKGKYLKENDKVTVSGIEGRYSNYNGIWVRFKSKLQKAVFYWP
jgi:hypothetical protein